MHGKDEIGVMMARSMSDHGSDGTKLIIDAKEGE